MAAMAMNYLDDMATLLPLNDRSPERGYLADGQPQRYEVEDWDHVVHGALLPPSTRARPRDPCRRSDSMKAVRQRACTFLQLAASKDTCPGITAQLSVAKSWTDAILTPKADIYPLPVYPLPVLVFLHVALTDAPRTMISSTSPDPRRPCPELSRPSRWPALPSSTGFS
jgi:hypothetical protein